MMSPIQKSLRPFAKELPCLESDYNRITSHTKLDFIFGFLHTLELLLSSESDAYERVTKINLKSN